MTQQIDNVFEQKLAFANEKWNKYVDKFIQLTDSKEKISSEFKEIANKYHKRRPIF